MSSEFDEAAKAVARNMPRRKVLKLFAGGVAAAIGSALIGSSASAQPFSVCEPVINGSVGSEVFINGTGGFNGDCFLPPVFWPSVEGKFHFPRFFNNTED
jgi:hypothetical protein